MRTTPRCAVDSTCEARRLETVRDERCAWRYAPRATHGRCKACLDAVGASPSQA